MHSEGKVHRSTPQEFTTFIVVAACATVAAWLVAYTCRMLGLAYPYNSPLELSRPLWDYYDYFDRFRLLHQPSFFTAPGYPFTYMPSGVLLYRLFYIFGMRPGFLVYLLTVIAAISFGFMQVRKVLLARNLEMFNVDLFVFVVLLTSYPLLFCLVRGNLEILLAAGTAVGVWAYRSGKTYTAAILWGAFGSVKIYPLILLALFLSNRQFRQLWAALGAAFATTLASLLYIGPTMHVALRGMRSSLTAFLKWYALAYDPGIGFDHSLFALIKVVLRPFRVPLLPLLHVYIPICGLVAFALYLLRVRRLPFANQLLFLITASILLPPVSFDYTLVQLYAPFIVFLLAAIDGSAGETVPLFVTFALLFTPTNFAFLHGHGYSGQIKAVFLLVLLWLSLRIGSPQEVEADASSPTGRATDTALLLSTET